MVCGGAAKCNDHEQRQAEILLEDLVMRLRLWHALQEAWISSERAKRFEGYV
jgi:hypothetical protein